MRKLFSLIAAACMALTMSAQVQQYNVAEAIAAAGASTISDNDSIAVRGVVTKIEFKGTNFKKFGSANIYVADATGAEGAFEFYNCYSLAADTFRTSDPAYDATSTAWVQFNSVTDGNGVTVHVGDTVIAKGKYKLFNTTYELNTGCYLTSIIEPAATPIVEPEIEYYLAGSMNSWAVNAAYKLAANPAAEGEYMGTFTFAANDEFKVVSSTDGAAIAAWFPTGMGNNYQITEAGDYAVYFRPDGNTEWANGYFTAVKQEILNVTIAEAISAGMLLDSMGVSEAVYAVEGYVINPGAFSMLYHNQSWYMADDAAATASDFQAYNCYAIQGADTLKVLNGDKVKLVGKLKKYYNKSAAKYIIEIEKGNASFISMVDGDHAVVSSVETATVAQALAIGAALENNASTEKQYTITGYVSAINVKPADAYSDQYKNQSFWVADDATSTASTNADGAFYVYRGKPETEAEIPVGTKVQFTCTIKKYVPSAGGDPVIENADQNIVIKILEDVTPVEDADVVFTTVEFNGLGTSGTGSEVNVVKDGVTFNCNKGFGDQYGVRCYKTSNVTITSAEQQIGKIVFEFATVSGTYYNGGLEEEIVVNGMEWKAENLSMQARMNKVKIYFGEYEKPIVAGPDTITVAQAVEIGMALADNALTEVEYVVKGWVVQAYAPNEGYTDQTWFMADEQGAFGEFEAYRCTPDYLVENDQFVYVKGKIQKYVKDEKVQIEIGKGTATHAWGQGIENVTLTEKAQKVVVDGVIYIVRDGKMFNLQGAQVR